MIESAESKTALNRDSLPTSLDTSAAEMHNCYHCLASEFQQSQFTPELSALLPFDSFSRLPSPVSRRFVELLGPSILHRVRSKCSHFLELSKSRTPRYDHVHISPHEDEFLSFKLQQHGQKFGIHREFLSNLIGLSVKKGVYIFWDDSEFESELAMKVKGEYAELQFHIEKRYAFANFQHLLHPRLKRAEVEVCIDSFDEFTQYITALEGLEKFRLRVRKTGTEDLEVMQKYTQDWRDQNAANRVCVHYGDADSYFFVLHTFK